MKENPLHPFTYKITDDYEKEYHCAVTQESNDDESEPETLRLLVDVSNADNTLVGDIEILYHISTREYDTLHEPGGELKELYPSIIHMLEETPGTSWGHTN